MTRILVSDVVKAVALVTGAPAATIVSRDRTFAVSHVRQLVMLVASEVTDASLLAIGRRLGARDHTTVVYGIDAARKRMAADSAYADEYRRVLIRLDDARALDLIDELDRITKRAAQIREILQRCETVEIHNEATVRRVLGLLDAAHGGPMQ